MTAQQIKQRKTKKPPAKEPIRYIALNDDQKELTTKTRQLWLIVAVFSIILLSVWLITLRFTVTEQSKKMNLNQISQNISDTLNGLNSQISASNNPKPEITAEELESIKNDLENQIKTNPNFSLWPAHQFNELKITINYPDNWQKLQESGLMAEISSLTATGTASDYGRLLIATKDNRQNQSLIDWLKKNKIDLTGYHQDNVAFKFSSSSNALVYSSDNQTTSTLDRLYFLKRSDLNRVYQIKAEATGDLSHYSPIITEIINSIK